MLRWYSSSVKELEAFFGVSLSTGLSSRAAHKRLVKEGINTDPSIPNDIFELYKAKVWRNGKPNLISATNLALGDVIELVAGDRAPADIRLVKVNKLQVDESRVVGTAHPVSKSTLVLPDNIATQDQKNMVFAGSIITSGSGLGVVVARNHKTVFAHTFKKPRVTVRQKITVTRLHKKGIYTQNPRVIRKQPKKIFVIVDVQISPAKIRTFLAQKSVNAQQFVFVAPKEYAGVLASALSEDSYYSTSSKQEFTNQKVFAKSTDSDVLRLIANLQSQRFYVLFVTGVAATKPELLAADSVLLTDTSASDLIKSNADFISKSADINTIEKLKLTLDK